MALSRLRHPVISRAPSLFRTRVFSSATFTSRYLERSSRVQKSIIDGDGTLLRTRVLSIHTGVHEKYFNLKSQTGFRCFSSAGQIDVGDVICEIETDKATLEFECLEEGFLAKILVPEGSKDVPVGQPIAITVEEADDISKVPSTIADGSEVKEKQLTQQIQNEDRVQESSSVKITTSELPPHLVLEMPALSPTMNQGDIAQWIKKEGDKIEVGDVICEIETDKATLEYECLEEGYCSL